MTAARGRPSRAAALPAAATFAAALLAACAVAGGCATPLQPAETTEVAPAPRAADDGLLAERPAPAIIPKDAATAAARRLADVQQRGGATLADCFELAELTNEDLLSGEEDRIQAALQRDLAMANILPTASLAAFGIVQDRVPASRSTAGNSVDEEELAIRVRQPIFQGFSEWRALDAARHNETARAAAIRVMRAALRRSVARAFYGVLQAEADVRTLEDSETLDRTRLDEMRVRRQNEIARRTEVLLLESQFERTGTALRRARSERDVARTTLLQIVGVELPAKLVLTAALPVSAPPRTSAVAEALRTRAELDVTDAGTLAAESLVGVARGARWPQVFLDADWFLARSGVSATSKATDWEARLSVEVPIFDGERIQARERTAQSELRRSRLAASAVLRGIVQEVDALLVRVAAGADLLAATERSAAIAAENLGLLQEEYRAGVATNLEVVTAQNVLQQAQLDVERERLQNRLDRVELFLALGRTELAP